jgi:hypothetical protein
MPLEQFRARVRGSARILVEEAERIAYVAERLEGSLRTPLTNPGSERLAKATLSAFPEGVVMPRFAEKALETLRDGQCHNRIAVSLTEPPVAVLFVSWSGTHREVQPDRFGNYLGPLLRTANGLVEGGKRLAALLEIDAYVRDDPDLNDPGRSLDQVFAVDVEYSYLPGFLIGGTEVSGLPNAIMLNPDLLSPDEHQALDQLIARLR